MSKSRTRVHSYSGSRAKKETRLGRAHLAPGMTEGRLLDIYARHGVFTLEDLEMVGDDVIDAMVAEVVEVISDPAS